MILEPHQPAPEQIDCDVAIFGSGAAGITLARQLDRGHRRIALFEAGGLEADPGDRALFRTASIGHPVETAASRVRAFGGTTEQWTGRTAPLDALDFARRDWIPDSGWPIDGADMAEPYRKAMDLCGFAPGWESDPPALAAIQALPERPAALVPFAWRFWATGRETYQHWGEAHYDHFARSAGVQVVLAAALIGLGGQGAVREARVRRATGDIVRVRARVFVLCCGGIENARLLLNIARDNPALLSTACPALGRYFMQHPRTRIADLMIDGAAAARMQALFNRFRRSRGLQFETGLALAAAIQAREGLVNASATWRYESAGLIDPARPLADGWRALRSAVNRLTQREPRFGRTRATLILDLEQQPDADSRILLSGARDALGLLSARIDWRINEPERRTAHTLANHICCWADALGFGRPTIAPGIESDGGLREDRMLDSFHHLGGTRMSTDPNRGVVDADLRVHGVANLYVCGGSVMPTGGHANPTLTIVALASRLADTLGERL